MHTNTGFCEISLEPVSILKEIREIIMTQTQSWFGKKATSTRNVNQTKLQRGCSAQAPPPPHQSTWNNSTETVTPSKNIPCRCKTPSAVYFEGTLYNLIPPSWVERLWGSTFGHLQEAQKRSVPSPPQSLYAEPLAISSSCPRGWSIQLGDSFS